MLLTIVICDISERSFSGKGNPNTSELVIVDAPIIYIVREPAIYPPGLKRAADFLTRLRNPQNNPLLTVVTKRAGRKNRTHRLISGIGFDQEPNRGRLIM